MAGTGTGSTPSVRDASKARTREALLSAGYVLAEKVGLEGLSVNAVVDTAGVAKGTFFHHFGDRNSYLVALHRQFHDRVFDQVQQATAGLAPGRQRLAVMASTYLDCCMANRGVRALIAEARGIIPIQNEIARRNDATVAFLLTDFITLGWPAPRVAARLWIAAVVECALLELDSGQVDADARTAVIAFAAGRADS